MTINQPSQQQIQNLLVSGATRLQPEEMMDALYKGADPFLANENGISGFSALIESSKDLRELEGGDPARSSPSSLLGRINSVLDKMSSQAVSNKNKDHFLDTLKSTFKNNAVNSQSLTLLKEKASIEGKTLSSQTVKYFLNKNEAGDALLKNITSSEAFKSIQNESNTNLLESLKEDPVIVNHLSQKEVSLYDINNEGFVNVRARLVPPPPITATAVLAFRSQNTQPEQPSISKKSSPSPY